MQIKILVVLSGRTGLQYHRQIVPHMDLAKDEDFKIMMTDDINQETDETLREFQIVHFLRQIDDSINFRGIDIVRRLRSLGCKIVMDLDDYWRTDKSHALHQNNKRLKYPEQVEQAIGLVDYVTCTHELLADKIKKFNQKVEVIANAIDPEDPQFKIREIKNNRVRFGWIGGVHHRPDVELMKFSIAKLYGDKTILDKFQICLGGFNTNTSFSAENVADLRKLGCDIERMRGMGYRELVDYMYSKNLQVPVPEYIELETSFTDNHKAIKDKMYLNYLRSFTQSMEHIGLDQPYRRLWGRDAFNYGQLYNDIDVALVPLVNNEFNNCKSQLKIIEAGFMKKSVIVSEVHPYTIDCINRENCLTVRPNMNLMDWFLHIKRMINEPNLREDMAAALHETVKEKYHVKTQNAVRKDLYKKICE